jgi:hypothetical protein
MRDLQNCMEDFSRMHDAANEYITPYTNFSDEGVSSELYLVLFVLSIAAFIASHLMPWRAIALLGGWGAVISGHPSAQSIILSTNNLKQFNHTVDGLQAWIRNWIERDIILDEPAEVRQVEIFELQKHHESSGTWESWLFSPSPYDPLSPSRIAGARAKGTQFFEEVQPPTGWRWKDKKWSLDLFSRESSLASKSKPRASDGSMISRLKTSRLAAQRSKEGRYQRVAGKKATGWTRRVCGGEGDGCEMWREWSSRQVRLIDSVESALLSYRPIRISHSHCEHSSLLL